MQIGLEHLNLSQFYVFTCGFPSFALTAAHRQYQIIEAAAEARNSQLAAHCTLSASSGGVQLVSRHHRVVHFIGPVCEAQGARRHPGPRQHEVLRHPPAPEDLQAVVNGRLARFRDGCFDERHQLYRARRLEATSNHFTLGRR